MNALKMLRNLFEWFMRIIDSAIVLAFVAIAFCATCFFAIHFLNGLCYNPSYTSIIIFLLTAAGAVACFFMVRIVVFEFINAFKEHKKGKEKR